MFHLSRKPIAHVVCYSVISCIVLHEDILNLKLCSTELPLKHLSFYIFPCNLFALYLTQREARKNTIFVVVLKLNNMTLSYLHLLKLTKLSRFQLNTENKKKKKNLSLKSFLFKCLDKKLFKIYIKRVSKTILKDYIKNTFFFFFEMA